MFNLIVDEYDGKTLSHDENNKQPFISPNPTTTNEETHKVHIISDFDMKEKNSENLEKRSCRPKNYMFCKSKIHKFIFSKMQTKKLYVLHVMIGTTATTTTK